MINLNKTRSFFLVSCILSSCLLAFCSKETTKPETVTFSGTVTLEGETDHSGVTVSLYNLVELDTALVRINQQYPNIGVQISQETEFDHREHSLIYSTTTDANGNWQIDGVIPGSYNVVAEKDSFGWKYEFEKQIDSGVSLDFGLITRAFYISGIISSDLILKPNQFLYLNGDCYLSQNVNLQFSENNTLIFLPQSRLHVNGKLIGTNLYGFKMLSSVLSNPGRGIVFENYTEDLEMKNIMVKNLLNPFKFDTPNSFAIKIVESYFHKCENGILAKNGLLNVKNSIFNNILYFSLELLTSFDIRNNIFLRHKELLINDQIGVFENNLFVHNLKAMVPFIGNIQIIHNEFQYNKIAIPVNSSDCLIEYNIFYNNAMDIELNANYVQQSLDYSNPIIRYNNFITSDTSVSVFGKNPLYGAGLPAFKWVGIDQDLAVENCYWGGTGISYIEEKIYDARDNPDYIYFIIYNPFSQFMIPSAGIIN